MTNRNRFSPHEGMKKMYEDAQRDMDAAAAERAEDAETTRRQEVFNDRLPAANDRAEYELFGSRGRTYTNPETGEVIADARNPQPGLIESMRTNQRYGKTEAERNAYADAYESRLETLTSDDGLELAQAKLLLDLEQADIQKRGKMIGEQITNGKSAVDAEKHVDALIGRLAEKRRGMIEAGGALSIEDYEQLRKGVDLYAETPEASPVDPVETEAPVQKKEHKGIYSGRSVEELEEVIRNADKHGDNSTASEAQRELDIIKLRQRTEEAWGKKPEATPSATAAETTKRNAAPSEADKAAAAEAARQASEASPETPSESDKAAAAEAASRASGDSEASTGEAEPNASEKEKSKKERRMGKIRRGFNRALTWLMAETKDDEGSSESKSKTSGGSAGAVGGMRKGFNSFRDQWKEQRASKIDTAAAADVKAEAKDAPKPAEADKAAAAAAVENAEIATDARGAGKPSDDEWGPGVPGDPIPGSPEVATSSSGFPEVEKAFAEAEKRVKEAEAKAQELEARQPEVVGAGEDGSVLTPAGEQLLRDRAQAKREAELAKVRLTMIKSMIRRDQLNKREVDYAQEVFAEAEKRAKEAEAKAQELEASQPEVVGAGEDGSILTPAGEQLLRDKASATLRAKEARGRADDLKVRVDSSARDLVAYRQIVLEALN